MTLAALLGSTHPALEHTGQARSDRPRMKTMMSSDDSTKFVFESDRSPRCQRELERELKRELERDLRRELDKGN